MLRIFTKRVIYFILELLDKYTTPVDAEKLLETLTVSGIGVYTDTGYKPISHLHRTKPFQIYSLYTDSYQLDCADEHIVFDKDFNEVFVKDLHTGDIIMTENGEERVKSIEILPNSICMYDATVFDENHRLYTNGILSHNTTTSVIFMLHYILFNTDKNSLVLGNKYKTAREILDKMKSIFLQLPHFLKPGVMKWNENEIVFDNGCRCMSEATTINSGISFTFHCVLSDEFAHIPPNIIDKFYNNIFPTITAGKAKFMITSTQNGHNLFKKLYTAAVAGDNDFKPFKVDWWQVPEWNPDTGGWDVRDDQWKLKQIANYGGEDAFNYQFGTDFSSTGSTLISGDVLRGQGRYIKQFRNLDVPGIANWESFWWHPEIEDVHDITSENIIISIDLAEGIGGDYTIFNINKMEVKNEVDTLTCIGYFRSNHINLKFIADTLVDFCSLYLRPEHYLISIERNTYGELFVKYIEDSIEDKVTNFSLDALVKYKNESQNSFQYGIKINRNNKLSGCIEFRFAYCVNIINHSEVFFNELNNFGDHKGNGTYAASYGNDDFVMTSIQLCLLRKEFAYRNFLDDNATHVQAKEYYNIYDF